LKRHLKRITGIKVPWFGVSWKPTTAEADVAQRVISFLEDRRVLYNPYEMEVAEHCVDSVLRIREFLTQVLTELPNKKGLSQHLRAMRAACRKFVDITDPSAGGLDHPPHMFSGGPDIWRFASALGELRGVIGLHVAIIAKKNKLGVEGELAAILPAAEELEDGP
jgi:hypothetical protein